ncbi:hypothetical protein GCM10007907_32200 [Chitinimonas prasina]|uniref:HEXXH motif domain-containing protein n=1 Tax=Chitinimonas prasina TaxID=1434937 RepID=A0ABQ5YHE9_9NEIS|nr:HEXXH motif-containing putative peptide modification protein [Chitinimonas prasina]GLR14430.1 hypothetical protein GCM10007907_32200 [Chitinimonas prasina]
MSTENMPVWQSTFQPDASRAAFAAMREEHFKQRIALSLETLGECERICRSAGLPTVDRELMEKLQEDTAFAASIFDDPVFATWLRFLHRAAANGRDQEVLQHCENLPGLLLRVQQQVSGQGERYVRGSSIRLQQYDIDPYIKAATPPTYDFSQSSQDELAAGHPLGMQADLLGIALEQIGRAWPELKEQVLDLVKIIGYFPDASFRSCSAARYSGVVYLGNMDESVLDIEESVVHETGHQVLYRLAELTPLTKPDTPLEANYVLPWSGSQRDLFGFLHAFYIYALLAKYYWRRGLEDPTSVQECHQRSMLILLGCMLALPMLASEEQLTEQGKLLVQALGNDMAALREQVFGVYRKVQ